MGLILVTEPRLIPVLEELKKREPIFHLAEYGTSRADFEDMTAPDFWEVGASGRRYSREYVIDTLVERHSAPHIDFCEARDFHCLEIAPDNYLITYTPVQGAARATRRATIWRRSADTWKIVYHQGTVVEDE